jgi:hypothetical protein
MRAVICTSILSGLDRKRIILSDRDTASRPQNGRPGRSANSRYPNYPSKQDRLYGLLRGFAESRGPLRHLGAVAGDGQNDRRSASRRREPECRVAAEFAGICKYGLTRTSVLGVSTLTPTLARAGGIRRRSKDVRDEAVRHQSKGGDARWTSNQQFLGVGERAPHA